MATQTPLRITVYPPVSDWEEEIDTLTKEGHQVMYGEEAEPSHLILGGRCWRMTEATRGMLKLAVKAAQGRMQRTIQATGGVIMNHGRPGDTLFSEDGRQCGCGWQTFWARGQGPTRFDLAYCERCGAFVPSPSSTRSPSSSRSSAPRWRCTASGRSLHERDIPRHLLQDGGRAKGEVVMDIGCDDHDRCEQGPCKQPNGHDLEWVSLGLYQCKRCNEVEKRQWFLVIRCGRG